MPTYNFDAIPFELKQLKQWCLWRYEDVGSEKPTKIPYSKDHRKLSVTNASDWLSFSDAVAIYNFGGYDGIGFVFTSNDPYAFIDLDHTKDKESVDRQLKVFKEFDSYSEKSPSGKGLHIIIKGSIPQGRKRFDIELYSSGRYATMTGDVFLDRPIENRNDLFNQIFAQMGSPSKVIRYTGDEKETQTDEEIIRMGVNAVNGTKFDDLRKGQWSSYYSSQSEADFSYIDMLAFYTQNRNQIYRLFKSSDLGIRDKANRKDYVNNMINRSFDRMLPKIDFDGLRIELEDKLSEKGNLDTIGNNSSSNDSSNSRVNGNAQDQLALPLAVSDNGNPAAFDAANLGSSPNAATNGSVAQRSEPIAHNGLVAGSNPAASTTSIEPPPGLVGEIAQFIYSAAPRPVPEIALAGAMGLMAGICGRAYNISGTGLNQYILCLAMTGAGKEAMASGIDKIINAVQLSVPVASEFIGPAEIASGQALIKYLANKSQSFVSILGEFGLRLRAMSSERANGAEIALRRMLLDLYNKSGHGQVARPSIYADSEKNTNLIQSPAFSILGESTPEKFYEILTEEMISEGLLPRFMLIEYNGARPALNEAAINAEPSQSLIEKVSNLMVYSKTVMANRKVINIVSTSEADKLLRDFDKYSDSKINSTDKEIIRQLWNRAHIKTLKIAGLLAVGVNVANPIVEIEHVTWAKNIVENDIKTLSDKFISGIIGKSTDELKQMQEIKRMIKLFVTTPWEKISVYCGDQRLYNSRIIPYSYLNKRLTNNSAFKHDRMGATSALKRSIQILIDSDYMREASKKELIDLFGTTQRSFVISNMSMLD